MEEKNLGKYLAIEVESGKYFLGETMIEAMDKAKERFPDKLFYFVRIGSPGVFTLSRQHLPFRDFGRHFAFCRLRIAV